MISDEYIDNELSQVSTILDVKPNIDDMKKDNSMPEVQEALRIYYQERNENDYLRVKIDRLNERLKTSDVNNKSEIERLIKQNSLLHKE